MLTTLFWYLLSVSLDSRWWRGFPNEKQFEVCVEESVEVLGHTFLLFFALLSGRVDERRSWESVKLFFRTHGQRLLLLLPWLLKRVQYRWLLVPLLLFGVTMYCSFNGYLLKAKETLESSAVLVMSIAVLLAFVQFLREMNAFRLWYLCLALNFLSREFHWEGAENVVYPALVVLMLVAWIKFDALATYLAHPRLLTILFVGFASYGLSQLIDMRRLPGVFRDRGFMNTPEESMEVLGHVFILCGTFLAARVTPEVEQEVRALKPADILAESVVSER
jgi:hypothetical protein